MILHLHDGGKYIHQVIPRPSRVIDSGACVITLCRIIGSETRSIARTSVQVSRYERFLVLTPRPENHTLYSNFQRTYIFEIKRTYSR
jgi:hypothetical protein